MVMRKHQRYFPLYKPASQDLLPHFITVANGSIDVPTVKVGCLSHCSFVLVFLQAAPGMLPAPPQLPPSSPLLSQWTLPSKHACSVKLTSGMLSESCEWHAE